MGRTGIDVRMQLIYLWLAITIKSWFKLYSKTKTSISASSHDNTYSFSRCRSGLPLILDDFLSLVLSKNNFVRKFSHDADDRHQSSRSIQTNEETDESCYFSQKRKRMLRDKGLFHQCALLVLHVFLSSAVFARIELESRVERRILNCNSSRCPVSVEQLFLLFFDPYS